MLVFVESYGCAANQGDASIACGILEAQGHRLADSADEADVVVLFTCCVIHRTEQRMLHRLRELSRLDVDLVVAGCMPAVYPDRIRAVAPHASMLGPREVHRIARLLDGCSLPENKAMLPRRVGLRLDVPIADGCRYSCSYCITRHARGRLTSYDEDALVSVAGQALRQGCRELRLTCQDTAAYGMDTNGSLESLVGRIAALPGSFRIRVGMMHPLSVRQRPGVLDVFEHDKVYRFLHLPLQSGSARVLQRMRRGYAARDVLDIVARARESYPDISVSTDVIVAFPGETRRDFEDTCTAVRRMQPDVVNVTRFSARPGTDAADMARPDTAMAKQRSRTLAALAQDVTREHMEQQVGTMTSALLLEKRDGGVAAKTDCYRSVYLSDGETGTLQRVRITGVEGNHLVGEIDGKEHI
ncbi:MAG: tRNA (N(6)-L-threonylcarbamoyladenosine(37)-C(2))-methylthiotransferase [Thermoplasmatota archaeon]